MQTGRRIFVAVTAALLAAVASGCRASHESSRIIYEVDPLFGSKQAGLLIVDADGGHRAPLIRGPRRTRVYPRYSSPVWSPDGSQVAFVKQGGSEEEFNMAVHVIRADGTGERRLAPAPATGPLEWSPDGTTLLAASCCGPPGPSKITLVRLGGGRVRAIAEGRDPTWSPDGSRIAFVHDAWKIRDRDEGAVAVPSLNSVHPDGTELRLLFRRSGGEGTRVGAPVWAPDGRSVLIPESDDVKGGDGRVRQVPAAGGTERVVARGTSPAYEDVMAVSPDAKLVAFASGKGIEIVSLATGQRTAVVNTDGEVDALAWSPDGTQLGYLAPPPYTDWLSLYVVKSDGSDRKVISKPGESVDSFDWQPEAARD